MNTLEDTKTAFLTLGTTSTPPPPPPFILYACPSLRISFPEGAVFSRGEQLLLRELEKCPQQQQQQHFYLQPEPNYTFTKSNKRKYDKVQKEELD